MTRALTGAELDRRDSLRSGFDVFVAERMPVLADFAHVLELKEPTRIVADPERYIGSIDTFMRDQIVPPEDRVWITTRIGYFIGEVLIQRLSGCWLLNELPNSRTFLRYVVGQFARTANQSAMIDPFEVAESFVDERPGRSLFAILAEIEAEIRAA